MRMTYRPLQWDRAVTPADQRRSKYAFKAPWSSTISLLDTELGALKAESVVLMADFQESDLRLDGLPRGNARPPVFPGVKLAFDSVHGRLTYATDTCEFWQHNVRSIALGLQALRAVDRYGISSRAEQYTGYKAIGTAMPPAAMTEDEAWRHLAAASCLDLERVKYVGAKQAYRIAARSMHPDAGGSEADMAKLNEALQVIEAATSGR